MQGPFSQLTQEARWRRFALGLAAMLAVMMSLGMVDAVLRSPRCPLGIVSFELAGDAAGLRAIMADWRARSPAPLYAAFSLGIDYLFMPLYAAVIALACALVAERVRPRAPRLAAAGALLGWGAWLAAACDAVENAALWRALADAPTDLRGRVAFVAASIKFTLVIGGVLYALGGAVIAAVGAVARRR